MISQSPKRCSSITPSDTADIPHGTIRGIYVGGAGNIVVVDQDGNSTTFNSAQAGDTIWVNAKRVNSTDTTATNLVALYD